MSSIDEIAFDSGEAYELAFSHPEPEAEDLMDPDEPCGYMVYAGSYEDQPDYCDDTRLDCEVHAGWREAEAEREAELAFYGI